MRRTFRMTGPRRFQLLLIVAMCGVLTVAGRDEFAKADAVTKVMMVLIPIGLLYLILEFVFGRTVADEEGVTRYNALNRIKFRFAYQDIEAYRPSGEYWNIVQQGRPYRLGEICFPDFHAIMVDRAPRALESRRLKFNHLPPSEDFTALCGFDFQGWVAHLIVTMILSAPFLAFWGWKALIFLNVPWTYLFFRLKDIFVTLNLLSDRLQATWPGGAREIAWEEVTAIFCEHKRERRFFVITAKDRSITIPAHISQDAEYMRKVFYSLPDGTLAVNFDDSFRGGYRRRRGKKIRLPAERAAEAILG